MEVFIRTDSSVTIGTGHLMRCMALAGDLTDKGAEVTFICRSLRGDLISFVRERGFKVEVLPRLNRDAYENWLSVHWKLDAWQTAQRMARHNIDWLIVDHYDLDKKWEQFLKPFVQHIMVIDDLADRPHACDVLLDQNLYKQPEKRYHSLVAEETKLLLGPEFLLLRDEFKRFPPGPDRDGRVKRILISFGGSDPTNETEKAIRAFLSLADCNLNADVVVGGSNRNSSRIRSLCAGNENIHLHHNIDYLSTLMFQADLAIGAGGSSTWERCYAALPAITIEAADNQTSVLSHLAQLGAVHHLGKSVDVDEKLLADALHALVRKPDQIKRMISSLHSIMRDFQPGLAAKWLIEGEGG